MKGYLISIWSLIDPFYYFCSRLTYPPCEGQEGNIFRIRLTKYKGRKIVLSDGTQISTNDTLVKIHLHNARLLKEQKNIKGEIKKTKMIYRYVQQSLPGIETYIRNHCFSDKIKGIIGITWLNKVVNVWDLRPLIFPILFTNGLNSFSFLPIGILSSQNSSIVHIFKHQQPKIFIYVDKKISKYVQTLNKSFPLYFFIVIWKRKSC